MKYIYHHLGLGDHIICNGLVRFFYQTHNQLKLFCKPHNFESVKFMYRDLNNFEVLQFENDALVENFIFNNRLQDSTIKVGLENCYPTEKGPTFDQRFYEQYNINFDYRWDLFHVHRDYEMEKKIFDHYDVVENNYIFIHDDNRFHINEKKIASNGLKIIRPEIGLTPNIFDYCLLIEKAKEVHTIESSLQFIIDSLNLNNENYVHRYARWVDPFTTPIYKHVKEILY